MGKTVRISMISIVSLPAYCTSLAAAAVGGSCVSAGVSVGLQVEIHTPGEDMVAVHGETMVEVEGVASTIGGVRYIDMIFVMDTSTSLRSADPRDHRSAAAIGLVENLSPRSDIQIGVVSFDSRGELVQMTSDRVAVTESLRNMPRSGSTNLAAGILKALEEFRRNGRPDSSRVIMLFTDGQSNRTKAHQDELGLRLSTMLRFAKIREEHPWNSGFLPGRKSRLTWLKARLSSCR